MQATIYVTQVAFDTANTIKDLCYHERMELCDEESTDISYYEGYHLKNANRLQLSVLPENAFVALRLTPEDADTYQRHVSFPVNLRGCIFEKAPDLPPGYAGIVTYWSGEPFNRKDSGAVHYQCPANQYLVEMVPAEDADTSDEPIVQDNLLSEGVVVCIEGLKPVVMQLGLHDFIEVVLPVDSMLSVESCLFRSPNAYGSRQTQQSERIFLKVADVLASPDCDRIYIDILRHELLDYGYWY